jgi:MoaA/NifB/PqqE/SkfB family radical SAM enzyme
MSLFQIQECWEKILSENSIRSVSLTGGEPMLHPNILDIAAFFSEKNIPVLFATNGILCAEEKIRELRNRGIEWFEISLPTTSPQKYKEITGAFLLERVKQAILNMKKHSAKVSVSFVISKLNFLEIESVMDLVFAFSVDRLALNRFVAGGLGIHHLSALQISEEELCFVLEKANQKAKEYKQEVHITIPIDESHIDSSRYPFLKFGAGECGRGKWIVDSLGNLRTCEQSPKVLGNLLENSFRDLIKSPLVASSHNADSSCKRCNSLEPYFFAPTKRDDI